MVVLSMLKPPESEGAEGSGSLRLRWADGGFNGGLRWTGICTNLCRLIYAPI